MTVPVNDTVERYTISGTGPYAFSFRIFDEGDLALTVIDGDGLPTTLVLDTDYTVPDASVNDEDGGTVSLITAVATLHAGLTLDIRSNTPLEQPTGLENQGAFRLRAIEGAIDRQARGTQDVNRKADASVRAPDYEVYLDMRLPRVANRINKYLVFDADGKPGVSAGTGTDSDLRNDLADSDASQGDNLIRVQYTASGSAALLLHDYIEDDGALNIMGFIPQNLKSAIRDQSSTTDLSTYMQTWADAVVDNVGNTIRLPRGRYTLETAVNFTPKTIIEGSGLGTSIRCMPSAHSTSWLKNALATAGADGYITFRNFQLILGSTGTYHSQIGIDLRDRSGGGTEHSSYCRVSDIIFQNWNLAAVYMDKSTVSYVDGCQFQSIKNLLYGTSAGVAWPILINGTGNSVWILRNYVTDSDAFIKTSGAATSAALHILGNAAEASANYANSSISEHIFIEGAAALNINGNYLEGLRTGASGGPGTGSVIRLKNVLGAQIGGGGRNYIQSDLGGTDVSYILVRVEGDCSNVVIEQNNLEDPTNAYALVETGAEDTILRDNFYRFGGSIETSLTAIRGHVSGSFLLEENEYSQTIAYAAAVTPNFRAGKYIAFGTLTGALTVNEPTNPPAEPGMPRDIFMEFTQDGTGGRNITFNAIFSAGYSNTGNTLNTKCMLHWHWDGAAYRLISQRGWA